MTLRIPALALGVLLLTGSAEAQTSTQPVPGIDIVKQKKLAGVRQVRLEAMVVEQTTTTPR